MFRLWTNDGTGNPALASTFQPPVTTMATMGMGLPGQALRPLKFIGMSSDGQPVPATSLTPTQSLTLT